jgi:hypothetical protein
MDLEPASHTPGTPAGHSPPAVWPWLLLPLAALTLFFALRTAKEWPASPAPHLDPPTESAPIEEPGLR